MTTIVHCSENPKKLHRYDFSGGNISTGLDDGRVPIEKNGPYASDNPKSLVSSSYYEECNKSCVQMRLVPCNLAEFFDKLKTKNTSNELPFVVAYSKSGFSTLYSSVEHDDKVYQVRDIIDTCVDLIRQKVSTGKFTRVTFPSHDVDNLLYSESYDVPTPVCAYITWKILELNSDEEFTKNLQEQYSKFSDVDTSNLI